MSKMGEFDAVTVPGVKTPYGVVLGIWGQWMRLSDQWVQTGDSNPQDTRDFMRAGEAVDAMVNDLPRVQWWAVRKSQGLSTVWRFPELSLMDALAAAETTLTEKMKRHIATRRFFY